MKAGMIDHILFRVEGIPVPAPRPRVTRRGTFYPERYTTWRDSVMAEALHAREGETLTGDVTLILAFAMPDRRRCDLDNLCKGVLDGLQPCLIANDSQVQGLCALRHVSQPAGVTVCIAPHPITEPEFFALLSHVFDGVKVQ